MNNPLFIAFGSNIDPTNNLIRGLTRLHAHIPCQAVSTVYRTKALTNPDQPHDPTVTHPDFLNGALLIQATWDPWELHRILKTIEIATGRQPDADRWGPRPLDLDIMLMGNHVMTSPDLTLPDPEILTRPFVAIPLAQLLPDFIHPIEKVSLATLAARFTPFPDDLIPDPATTAQLQAIIR